MINRSDIPAGKKRLCYIDNLRVLACFLVLLTHSTMPTDFPERDGFWMFSLSFIGSPSSELFLALSGTVLLPVKSGFRRFYNRRFLKLLPPLIIWSVLGVLLYTQTKGWTMTEALNRIVRIPFAPAVKVYWFVYVMIGLYLLAPIISPWIKNSNKKQLEFFLSIWGFNALMPWIQTFFPDFLPGFRSNGDYYWEFCYFGGFLGFWILGYYLNTYPIKIGLNRRFCLLTFLTIAYPIIILIMKLNRQDTDALTGGLSTSVQLGSVAFVAMLYTILQEIRIPNKIQRVLTEIAKYSFGIYLTHIYIARDLYWGLFDGANIHIFPRTFLIALLTLLTGYTLTRLLAIIPKGKYIVGA